MIQFSLIRTPVNTSNITSKTNAQCNDQKSNYSASMVNNDSLSFGQLTKKEKAGLLFNIIKDTAKDEGKKAVNAGKNAVKTVKEIPAEIERKKQERIEKENRLLGDDVLDILKNSENLHKQNKVPRVLEKEQQ
jgi:hypothetical protein